MHQLEHILRTINNAYMQTYQTKRTIDLKALSLHTVFDFPELVYTQTTAHRC